MYLNQLVLVDKVVCSFSKHICSYLDTFEDTVLGIWGKVDSRRIWGILVERTLDTMVVVEVWIYILV
jgi:hypothetical protein